MAMIPPGKMNPKNKENLLLGLQLAARAWLFVGIVVTIAVGVIAESPAGAYSLIPWVLSEASIVYVREYL